MVYNLSFINYAGGHDGQDLDEMKNLNKLYAMRGNLTWEWMTLDAKMAANVNQTSEEMQRMTRDLKKDIMATNVEQTKEMERMTTDLKKDIIMATNVNQTKEMQRMTEDLKKDIMATNVNQTLEMQRMIADLKEEINATNVNRTEERRAFHREMQQLVTKLEMWVTKVNQTVEGRV